MGPTQKVVLEILVKAKPKWLSIAEIREVLTADDPSIREQQVVDKEIHAALSGMGKCLDRFWVKECSVRADGTRQWKSTERGEHALMDYAPKAARGKVIPSMWIVMGGQGEEDHHREWPVCLYRKGEKALADRHAKLAQEFTDARGAEVARLTHAERRDWWQKQRELGNPYDPAMGVTLGAEYRVASIEIRTKIPKPRTEAA